VPQGKLPARSEDAFSSYLLLLGDDKIPVPAAAVFRDHGSPVRLAAWPDMCLGCQYGTCPHAWPSLEPRCVIVLGARDRFGVMRFGWFVQVEGTAKPVGTLTRVPKAVAAELVTRMRADTLLRTSCLLSEYLDHCFEESADDEDGEVDSFVQMAAVRFNQRWLKLQHRDRACGTDEQTEARVSPSLERQQLECGICLTTRPSTMGRCGTCRSLSCAECSAQMRGLCSVCDRELLNTAFVCQSCQFGVPLRSYAFPCLHCGDAVLCERCFTSLAECARCEAARPRA